ncbi:type II secretion system minor pseudopilin GspH [Endozoicomonas sp. G2_1]|uniref:type II secretion system minor pseudopilin GspH n=1 Tax=Endozoicomonas sp. G2_1 TaxID=2821091 RepID=UPI001AD97371|nr:type II secretion system minor pseudopilin GspH [Endozoicomonas sp. G2_1]MBO9491886.1 type II secretion system minor pseudopilin GspH [Endozoicomonas sp. G2_1]
MIRKFTSNRKITSKGFTLIEVMLVIVVIGIMVSVIGVNFTNDSPDKKLTSESARFAGIFDIATEYGMLNNVELGVVIEKSGYQIVGYDGTRWAEIPNQPAFTYHQFPEGIEAELVFDDLPLEASLFDSQAFIEQQQELQEQREEENERTSNNRKEKVTEPLPQIYLLSGGDITPFSLILSFSDEFAYDLDISVTITGLYSPPLTVGEPTFEP